MVGRKPKTQAGQVALKIVILKRQPNGSLHWVEAAKDLESAKARVRDLTKHFPGEYVILNKKSGKKIIVRVAGSHATRKFGPAVN
jgi:hypothetical protein